MVTWIRNPGVTNNHSAFVRVIAPLGGPAQAVFFTLYGAEFASPGTVDANLPLRFQYEITDQTLLAASIKVNFDAADVAANPGKTLAVAMYAAPASSFSPGAVPSPSSIKAAAIYFGRTTSGLTAAGDLTGNVLPGTLSSTAWTPNVKWWVMIVPVAVANMGIPPNGSANDTPFGPLDTLGRAMSVWTNRSPAAPVITAPTGRVTVFAGSEVRLTFDPQDPDEIAFFPGDARQTSFADVAGVQIQYAPVPTPDDPTPTWVDMPITNTLGTATGRGWHIQDSITEPANDGAKAFRDTFTMKIRCGATTLSPGTGNLPSGDWQVRVRTFDYGHPFPYRPIAPFLYPLNDNSRTYTPDTYPAVNTSPWSNPVVFSVSSQVPPPIPLSPRDRVAIPQDATPVTLHWQYRNTYTPPYPQAEREIMMRVIGSGAPWATYSSAGSSTSFTFVGTFAVGPYEWKVRVKDSSGMWSEFSESAFFYVVPTPESGGVRPVPADTIDGATLGCGTHRVEVYRRGGTERVGEITQMTHVDWERKRDDISTAQVVVSGWDIDCGKLLAKLQTWAYELVIWRDNGYSVDRVWEGPITLLTYEVDKVVIDAKDVMAYAYRRIIKQAMSDSKDGATVVDRAVRVLQNAFAPDDPNVLAYMTPIIHSTDAMQYRSLPAYSRTAFEEVDDMAANAGLDYGCVGRSILIWGTKSRIGTLPEFKDSDFGTPPIVSEYGMSMSNRYVVSDGNGVWGEATRLDVSGNDPTYGLVEMLSSTWASDAEDETGTYTQEGIATVVESFKGFAERSIASRYPPPVVVRVPDNTTLNPGAVVSIQQLVPGVVMPLRATGTLRPVVADQKLDSIKVVEEAQSELISITLSPFNYDDVEEVPT